MPLACNLCNKDFNFDALPTDRPVFCPDCGSPAILIDGSELLQRRKRSNTASNMVESPKAAKTDRVEPLRINKTISYSNPRYNCRKALILSSVGAVLGILGIGHLYIKKRVKGIGFLIGGFFFYLTMMANLSYYH
jgi:hypothetical protein